MENSGPPPQQVGPTEISPIPNSSAFLSFAAERLFRLRDAQVHQKASELDGDPSGAAEAKHTLLDLPILASYWPILQLGKQRYVFVYK